MTEPIHHKEYPQRKDHIPSDVYHALEDSGILRAMKCAVITGVTGQDGSYLAELLLSKDYEVHGIVRRASTFNRQRIDHLRNGRYPAGRFQLHYGDLADDGSLIAVLDHLKPDEVYNLAAQSHVGISFTQPVYTGDVTGIGTIRLLEAIRRICPEARFYQASSSELYGKVKESPQNEDTPFHPRSPYAVAKLYAYWACVHYREAYGMYAVNGILFNHESPRRGENFVTRKITMGVADILAGRKEHLSLGNLEARRDWGFAGDFVEGMWMLLQQEEPRDFVLGTGETHSVREFVELAFDAAGMPLEWKGEGTEEIGVEKGSGITRVRIDPRYFRPAEVDVLLADPSRAREVLGWVPKTRFADLVKMMLKADIEAARG